MAPSGSDPTPVQPAPSTLPAEASAKVGPSGQPCGAAAHTPGPWEWMGNEHHIYLATTHSGRIYVMGFKHRGMQGAEPMFQVNKRMVPASELVKFDVGDGKATGFAEGKADPSVYRYDVATINAPDARLIAAAPELLDALEALERHCRNEGGLIGSAHATEGQRVRKQVQAAIAKARGS